MPLPSNRPPSVIAAPRRKHSQKPHEVYQIIERMCPNTRKVELFARGRPRKGWRTWGAEVTKE
jgi:N6-adenosine-specific RNA methylase IME4